MARPGSTWDKLPKLGKAAAHVLGAGHLADAADALTGVSDPALERFVARAARSLSDHGTACSGISEHDRDAAADALLAVLADVQPVDAWGAAADGPEHVHTFLMNQGGNAALDRFAVHYIPRDDTEPGRILQPGEDTPPGHAFLMLVDLVADGVHQRAMDVPDTERAAILGLLRRVRDGQRTTDDALTQITDILELLTAQSGPRAPGQRWPGLIRIGEDACPREATAFVERAELDAIRTGFESGSAVTLCQLQGMRGVGKSQLAAAYARECDADGYDMIAWIDSRTRSSVVTNLGRLVAAYAPGDPDEAPDAAVARLLDAFATAAGDERRLIVFDNVERYADLYGCTPKDPRTRVIMTTVLTGQSLGTRIPVEVFTDDMSADYLGRRTLLHDDAGARSVAHEVGNLALALAQSAAVISARGYDYARFLAALRARPLRDNLLRDEAGDYPLGAARAIEFAIEAALSDIDGQAGTAERALRPELIIVLDALAVLAEGGAPVAWLRSLGDEFRIDDAIARLVGSSLASYSDDRSTVTLHHLTRRVYAEAHLAAEPELARAQAVGLAALAGGQPPSEGVDFSVCRAGWAGWLAYLATVLSSETPLTGSADFISVGQRGVIGGNEHHLPYAVIACAALPDAAAEVLGPDHPNTLTSRNNLAGAYGSAGDLGRAIPLYTQTLTDSERVLGPDHPDTLTSRNNLAGAYRSAGDLGRAIPLYQATLTDSERVLGPDHPDTLTSRNNLAIALWQNGNREAAYEEMQGAAEQAGHVLSAGHPLARHLADQAATMRAALGDDGKG
ncbi:MAG: tetratricopeptide repeat protein [Tetrasphaera sp.]